MLLPVEYKPSAHKLWFVSACLALQDRQMRETQQTATQLQATAADISSKLGRFLKGLPPIAAALRPLELPSEQQARQMPPGYLQQLAGTAAAVIDAVVPATEAGFEGQVACCHLA